MKEQERAFKGDDVVRFLKHLLRQIPGKLLLSYGTALRYIGEGRSKTTSPAELPGGLNWSSYPSLRPRSEP
jgi:hypothetical protein